MQLEDLFNKLTLEREAHEHQVLGNQFRKVNFKLIYPIISLKEENYINQAFEDEQSSFLYDIDSNRAIRAIEAARRGYMSTFK